jgi:hypothetical protein
MEIFNEEESLVLFDPGKKLCIFVSNNGGKVKPGMTLFKVLEATTINNIRVTVIVRFKENYKIRSVIFRDIKGTYCRRLSGGISLWFSKQNNINIDKFIYNEFMSIVLHEFLDNEKAEIFDNIFVEDTDDSENLYFEYNVDTLIKEGYERCIK